MIELVLLSDIKERLAIPGDETSRDDVLTTLIVSVSARIERHVDRQIEKTTTTEYFDVEAGQTAVFLKAYPVASVTTVHFDTEHAWGSDKLVGTSNYTLSDGGANGMLVFDPGYLTHGANALKVVYIGGLADSTEELLELYADLSDAALRQVLSDYNRRKLSGASHVASGGTGSVSYESDAGLLQSVKDDLRRYRRYGY